MSHFIFREKIVIFSIAVIFLFLSLYPTFNFYRHKPYDSVYTFIHNSVSDYPYYISFIRQGIEGRNTTIDQFTSEPQTPALIHIFYLGLGKIGSVFFLSPIQIYFISRIILGTIFILTGYALIRFFIKRKWERILSFLFFLASGSFPRIISGEEGMEIGQYLFWWTEVDPLRRITFIPHFLFGHIGLMMVLLLFLLLQKNRRPLYLMIAVIWGFAAGLFHPPSLGMIYFVLGAYLMIDTFRLGIHKAKTNLLYFLVLVVLTLPSLLYIYKTTNNVFPWTLMKVQESLFYAISIMEYLLSFGPIIILGIFGIILSRSKREYLILTLWVIIDIVMIPMSKIIAFTPLPIKIPTFANIRFLSMGLQLPLSILSIYFLRYLNNKFGKKMVLAILGIYTILTVMIYPDSWQAQINDFAQVRQFVYPKTSLITAFKYLDKNTGEDETVLTTADNSLLLPLFARNKVFFGQSVYTYNNEFKKEKAGKFFNNSKKNTAYQFLKENNISYILTDDISADGQINQYPFLVRFYEGKGVNIYKVDKSFH